MKTFIALSVASVAILIGVGYIHERFFKQPYSYSGKVVRKEYSPAKGKGRTLQPDSWWVYIRDSLGVHPTQVDMITFHQIRVGQDITLPNSSY